MSAQASGKHTDKIWLLEQMVAERGRAKTSGRSVVLTNGCFDLMHVGHVRYLEAAAGLGDLLFVALNGDTSVRQLKGEGRPFNTADDRAEMLAALEDVDGVVLFDDLTASDVVAAVQPDIYVKGGDYSDQPYSAKYPPEARVATAHGGSVHIIPFERGYSTTGLIERIRGA